jgi:hypothetical protein
MAIDMIQSVLDTANDAIDEQHLKAAMQDLAIRVDDWKALKVDGFGDLLRFGTFTVLKGDSNKDSEREVSIEVRALFILTSYAFPFITLAIADLQRNSIIYICSNEFYFVARTLIPTNKKLSLLAQKKSHQQT